MTEPQDHIDARTDARADAANPFFETWSGPFGVPPFASIAPEHFRDALERGFAEHNAQVAAVAADPAEPSFDNTVAALERSGAFRQMADRWRVSALPRAARRPRSTTTRATPTRSRCCAPCRGSTGRGRRASTRSRGNRPI